MPDELWSRASEMELVAFSIMHADQKRRRLTLPGRNPHVAVNPANLRSIVSQLHHRQEADMKQPFHQRNRLGAEGFAEMPLPRSVAKQRSYPCGIFCNSGTNGNGHTYEQTSGTLFIQPLCAADD